MSEMDKNRNYAVLKEEQRKQDEKREQERRGATEEEERQKREAADQEERQKLEDAKKEEALRVEREAKDNAVRLAEQAQEMRALEEANQRLEQYKREKEQEAVRARQQEQERARSRPPEGEINNAHARYGQALGQHYDVRDPYASLARASMAEYGAFVRDRENLDRQIAMTQDPAARDRLETRKQIEAAEYMALTSNRIATQSEIITGKLNSEEAQKQRARASAYQEQAKSLREGLRERQQGRDGTAPAAAEKKAVERGPDPNRPPDPPRPEIKSKEQLEQERLARARARTEALNQASKERQRGHGLKR